MRASRSPISKIGAPGKPLVCADERLASLKPTRRGTLQARTCDTGNKRLQRVVPASEQRPSPSQEDRASSCARGLLFERPPVLARLPRMLGAIAASETIPLVELPASQRRLLRSRMLRRSPGTQGGGERIVRRASLVPFDSQDRPRRAPRTARHAHCHGLLCLIGSRSRIERETLLTDDRAGQKADHNEALG